MTTAIPVAFVGEVKITPENKCGYCWGATYCTHLTSGLTRRAPCKISMCCCAELAPGYPGVQGQRRLVSPGKQPLSALQPGGRWGIHETRPQICREQANDSCEFAGPSGHEDFELFFSDDEALLAYCRARFKNWNRRFQKEVSWPACAPPVQA